MGSVIQSGNSLKAKSRYCDIEYSLLSRRSNYVILIINALLMTLIMTKWI